MEEPILTGDSAKALTKLLEGLRPQKAYLGLAEQIDRVLEMSRDPAKDIRAVQEFLHFVLCNGLFIEKYLNIYKG